ncbi:hypothetical protein [Kingella potus]|uniref:hypothetical protein n=1 Tax=Kingella potus TaxID=265175 RepID=UPI001FD007E4|nr:hypothetical protein [Kingella potus]UOP01200.1 hypothetical protein LVJ84_02535 [Kingella potus]
MMKNIKKYLKLHLEKRESSFQTQGCYYPPASWEEFERWNESTFDQNFSKCSDDDSILTTKIYISLFDNLKDFAFYSVFKDLDFEKLNNALFQTSREELLKTCIFPSGTDHCHAFFESLSAFACNDFEVIESLFPAELPSGAGRYYTENAVNLLKILYFGQEDLKEEALRKAEKIFAEEKNGVGAAVCAVFAGFNGKKCRKSIGVFAGTLRGIPKTGFSAREDRQTVCPGNPRPVPFGKDG